MEKALPCAIPGFERDNDGAFLNWHLADYFLGRSGPVAFTRSRPYRKNDHARVEQKTWTHVRQLVGYDRLAEPVQAGRPNDLYAQEWGQFRNFFCPAMKHLRTDVEGSRKKRIHDTPKPPSSGSKPAGKPIPGRSQNSRHSQRHAIPLHSSGASKRSCAGSCAHPPGTD